MEIVAFALILYCVCDAASAETVSVTSGPGPKPPRAEDTTFRAACPNQTYQINLQRLAQRLSFQVNQQNAVDITDTALGHSMRNRFLYGRVGLACLPEGLNVQFFGFDTSQGVAAPMTYRAVINATGKVDGGEVQATSLDVVIANKTN